MFAGILIGIVWCAIGIIYARRSEGGDLMDSIVDAIAGIAGPIMFVGDIIYKAVQRRKQRKLDEDAARREREAEEDEILRGVLDGSHFTR